MIINNAECRINNAKQNNGEVVKKTIILCISLILICAFLSGCFIEDWIDPKKKDYLLGFELYKEGEYNKAANIFAELEEYRDSEEAKNRSLYYYAGECFAAGDYDEAIGVYTSIEGYQNSSEKKTEAENEKNYTDAVVMFENGEYDAAKAIFEALAGYRDSGDYVAWIVYSEANKLMPTDSEGAIDMFFSLIGYDEELTELINDILYDKALSYMQSEIYEKALPVFEKLDYKESAALSLLCGKYISYNSAVAAFERGETDFAYEKFVELGDFIDSIPYTLYIEAKKEAGAQNYGEAAELYLRIRDYFDSAELYEECIYLYYDGQFQLGNRDLSTLPLLPLTGGENEAWRTKRLEGINKAIDNSEELRNFVAQIDPETTLVGVTGVGIYINDRMNSYYVKDLTDKIIADLPVFFLADSPGKLSYVVNFPGSSEYFGTYDDGTLGYETTITMTIKDTVSGEVVFSKNYTAYPPHEVYYPESQKRDVYAVYDFFEEDESGTSAYEREIWPALRELFELFE